MTNEIHPTIDTEQMVNVVGQIQDGLRSGRFQSFFAIGIHDNGEIGIFMGGKHPHMFILGVLTSVQQSFLTIANQITEQAKKTQEEAAKNNNGHKV